MIVLAPDVCSGDGVCSPLRAFDLADKYRMTSMILADGTLGQMMEPVELDMSARCKNYEKPWATTGTKAKKRPTI